MARVSNPSTPTAGAGAAEITVMTPAAGADTADGQSTHWVVAPSWGDHPDTSEVALEKAYFGIGKLADEAALFVHRRSDGSVNIVEGPGSADVICLLGRGNRTIQPEEVDALSACGSVELVGGLVWPDEDPAVGADTTEGVAAEPIIDPAVGAGVSSESEVGSEVVAQLNDPAVANKEEDSNEVISPELPQAGI